MESKPEFEPSAVSVAVRVRPLIGAEKIESPQICVSCDAEHKQVTLGADRQVRITVASAKSLPWLSHVSKSFRISTIV